MVKSGYYFGSGPTTLPASVSRALSEDDFDIGGVSLRLYELSHRHPISVARVQRIFHQLRVLYDIPDEYEILFQSGGARHQYELVPLNFRDIKTFRFLDTGLFSRLWAKTALDICPLHSTVDRIDFSSKSWLEHAVPNIDNEVLCVVTNETADGVMLHEEVASHRAVVADVTSDLGFRRLDISRYAMLFASTGKAFGVSGMTILIIRKDFLAQARDDLPRLQSYLDASRSHSMYSTPPLYCINILGHMIDWMIDAGGIDKIEEKQKFRSDHLYGLLQRFPVYELMVGPHHRSLHNVCFSVRGQSDQHFNASAINFGIHGLQGHSSIGGMRISLTHGVSDRSFEFLCDFLNEYGDKYSGNG